MDFQRSKEWTNELSLYSSGLEVCPNNAKIHYNLGKVLNDLGNEVEAERNYWNAIQYEENYEIFKKKISLASIQLMIKPWIISAIYWRGMVEEIKQNNCWRELYRPSHTSLVLGWIWASRRWTRENSMRQKCLSTDRFDWDLTLLTVISIWEISIRELTDCTRLWTLGETLRGLTSK